MKVINFMLGCMFVVMLLAVVVAIVCGAKMLIDLTWS